MRPRDPKEPHRSASPLELFFDLVFVVAVSIAAVQLHHDLTENHIADGLLGYALVFFAIWWAWMNFTWFATSFDTDDWLYRVLTVVQMAGVLTLAAGIEPSVVDENFTIVVIGYVVMRVAMVTQWLRASRNPEHRQTALTYAIGIAGVQVLWIAWVLLLDGTAAIIGFVVLAGVEMSVPIIAERKGATPWHPHHITERYGLFTLILLGESLLASANAIIEALHDETALAPLISISILTVVVTASLWWIYFWPPHHRAIGRLGNSLFYGYAHYFIFAAAGAFSAGIEVEIDVLTEHSKLGDVAASFTVTIPIAVFVLGVWLIAIRANADRLVNIVVPAGAVLVLFDPVIPIPITLTAVVMIVVVAVLVARGPRDVEHEKLTA
ncbi:MULTISPECIES: low temperature requirement protein A [unclassified Rhodococcus (in: high G+C Gram-positive bacteria)]|uniref:low temperature requirement protein A n=1 Tax=unclassified Rhodococcus (in: high G+C Gram-positive bacteria) TaxID=192944 RepID=UPI000B9BD169|nr:MULTISPECIES: low temperature requirement protein A [unclassified Rhodococcus (in: high G+C Gram-positive bacteria)]OZE30219.1 low temperature requirement protein A [Rhodococcus sp. 05-2254-6]OZE33425.1 low temperature requirement protein A [Rhodococcus sp. 05-2254-4]OZE44405.1 low temperature requirement protein A [Rhodococcus sp. 05-2254-3]OZE56642.1 low temperature requirement protein A [Rhodococcus sp. 05-2254-2]